MDIENPDDHGAEPNHRTIAIEVCRSWRAILKSTPCTRRGLRRRDMLRSWERLQRDVTQSPSPNPQAQAARLAVVEYIRYQLLLAPAIVQKNKAWLYDRVSWGGLEETALYWSAYRQLLQGESPRPARSFEEHIESGPCFYGFVYGAPSLASLAAKRVKPRGKVSFLSLNNAIWSCLAKNQHAHLILWCERQWQSMRKEEREGVLRAWVDGRPLPGEFGRLGQILRDVRDGLATGPQILAQRPGQPRMLFRLRWMRDPNRIISRDYAEAIKASHPHKARSGLLDVISDLFIGEFQPSTESSQWGTVERLTWCLEVAPKAARRHKDLFGA